MTANRCGELSEVPANHNLRLVADALDISEQSPKAELVDDQGARAWSGKATLRKGRIQAALPPITRSGEYFFRLYSERGDSRQMILREYALRVVQRPRRFAIAQACAISFARRCISKLPVSAAWQLPSR